jgi:hypothetical protein
MFDRGVVYIVVGGYNVDHYCLRLDRGVVHYIIVHYCLMFDRGVVRIDVAGYMLTITV